MSSGAEALRSIPEFPAFCNALQHALRVAALVTADADDGTPGVFAMFQAASLLTQISSQVASAKLAEAIAPIRAKQDFWSLLDNSTAMHALISMLGTVWLAFAHLRRHTMLLAVMALLSIAASPVTLALGWPEACKLLGMPTSEASPQRGLLRFTSVLYAGTAGATLLSGGTVGMISAMLVVQLLARIHGTEAFASLFT
ncbi:unnamed protein product [Symbiodinium natans]|uniref:Uncharacterized protein n=1 Tax=Symbiodinium natans TaxID=878477 RepID=A0A812TT40_9DINO|nr:unnamed protein product [Symbiodinium natans]